MEISTTLSKQPFSTGYGRITLRNWPRDYSHILKYRYFRLQVLRCDGSYSQVFTVDPASYLRFRPGPEPSILSKPRVQNLLRHPLSYEKTKL